MDEDMAAIFDQISDQISVEEFDERVAEKVSLMGGLCDEKTAAMLVARDLGSTGEVPVTIDQIKPESGKVVFIGKVVSLSEVREFTRSDGSEGKVSNVSLGDETGSIKLVLWDESAELVGKEIKVGQVLKVRGFSREGYSGTEVNLGQGGGLEEVDADIRVRMEPYKISEIGPDMGDVNLVVRVVDPGEAREFRRKDGSAGQVRSVILGDETGKIRLTLWDDKAGMDIGPDDTIELINVYSRERYDQVEIQAGSYSVVRKSDLEVAYEEKVTGISDLEVGSISTISGFVTGLGEVREFERENGSLGRVAEIHVSDQSGRVKGALWGDHARLIEDLDLGSKIELVDCQVRRGWNGDLEVSCGWETKIKSSPPD